MTRRAEAVARADRAVINIRGSGPGGWVRVVRWAHETHRWTLRPEALVAEFRAGKSLCSIARWHVLPLSVVDDVIRWHARRAARKAS